MNLDDVHAILRFLSTGIDSQIQMLYADSCLTGGGKGCCFPSKGEQEKVDNQCSEWASQPKRILPHTRGRKEWENKLALIAIIKSRALPEFRFCRNCCKCLPCTWITKRPARSKNSFTIFLLHISSVRFVFSWHKELTSFASLLSLVSFWHFYRWWQTYIFVFFGLLTVFLFFFSLSRLDLEFGEVVLISGERNSTHKYCLNFPFFRKFFLLRNEFVIIEKRGV